MTLDVMAYERAARRIWTTFQESGLDAMLAVAGDDVVWEPLTACGAALTGSEALRAHRAQLDREGRSLSATAYRFERRGACILISGTLRELDRSGLRDSQPTWVFFFDGDARLRRATGFRTRAAALAAAEPDGVRPVLAA